MAIGVVKLTKKQRTTIGIVLAVLNSIQMGVGLIFIVISTYINFSVAPILYSERAEVCYVFVVIALFGLNTIAVYLFGLKIVWKCLIQAQKKSTRTLVFAWICLSFFVVVELIILSIYARKVYKHIIRSMKHSLLIGMRNYLKDQIWKVTIDRIQFDLQCCGVEDFKEWHETNWLGPYQVEEKAELVKKLRTPGTWEFPVTPWSCCRINFQQQCLHDPLQQVKSSDVWVDQPSLVTESINTNGCLQYLRVPLYNATVAIILLIALVCLVQIFIFILVRILYTSCRNALILDQPDGISPGWIFGRGDCGYNRGKNLLEIIGEDYENKRPPAIDDTLNETAGDMEEYATANNLSKP